jgi:Subtilase family
MPKNERDTDPKFMVEIGCERFDPTGETAKARRRANSDKTRLAATLNLPPEAIPGTERQLWIVQFADDPDLETITRFRDDYSLQLAAGLTSLTFVESMTAATADRVRRESQVRACIPYWSELKLARSSLLPAEEIAGERLLRLGLVEDASESLLQKLDLLGFQAVGEATPYPGGFLFRVMVGEAGDPKALLLLNEVEWVEDVRGYLPTNASSSAVVQGGGAGGSRPIWDQDLHGEGQIIGILDEGVPDMAHDFFRDPDHPVPGPTHRKALAIRASEERLPSVHATGVCGCAAGDDVGARGAHPDRGGAWAAKLVYTDIFHPLPDEGSVDAALKESFARGARVHNMSASEAIADPTLPAPYTADSASWDHELWFNEYLLLVGVMSNTPNCDPDAEGFSGAPGTAKNPLSVSGTRDFPNQDTFFTGVSGTGDGRRKPDLVAVGDNVRTSDLTIPPDAPPNTPPNTAAFSTSCGTSLAAPHVAAAAALVCQYFQEGFYPSGKSTGDRVTASSALLKAVLLNATVPPSTFLYPTDEAGWGRLELDKTLHFEGDKLVLQVKDVPHLWGFDSGPPRGGRTFSLRVPDSARSMKITLVFNDPAGAVGAKDPVVNKLDLIVMEPMRSRSAGWEFGYFGNDFDRLVSRRRRLKTGITSVPPDMVELKNNVRQVVVESPVAGNWGLHVSSHRFDKANTPKEWRRGRNAQGYAWVARVELK